MASTSFTSTSSSTFTSASSGRSLEHEHAPSDDWIGPTTEDFYQGQNYQASIRELDASEYDGLRESSTGRRAWDARISRSLADDKTWMRVEEQATRWGAVEWRGDGEQACGSEPGGTLAIRETEFKTEQVLREEDQGKSRRHIPAVRRQFFSLRNHWLEPALLVAGKHSSIARVYDEHLDQFLLVKKVVEPYREEDYEELLRVSKIQHRTVALFQEAYATEYSLDEFYIVSDGAPPETLREVIERREKSADPLTGTEVSYITHEILWGIRFLQKSGLQREGWVAPTELNAKRVGVTRATHPWLVQLLDCGFGPLSDTYTRGSDAMRRLGVDNYTPPEMLIDDGVNNQDNDGEDVDWESYASVMWRVGCLTAEAIRGKPLFDYKKGKHSSSEHRSQNKKRLELWEQIKSKVDLDVQNLSMGDLGKEMSEMSIKGEREVQDNAAEGENAKESVLEFVAAGVAEKGMSFRSRNKELFAKKRFPSIANAPKKWRHLPKYGYYTAEGHIELYDYTVRHSQESACAFLASILRIDKKQRISVEEALDFDFIYGWPLEEVDLGKVPRVGTSVSLGDSSSAEKPLGGSSEEDHWKQLIRHELHQQKLEADRERRRYNATGGEEGSDIFFD